MRLILVRHGESEDNLKGVVSGQSHSGLSARGKEQARIVGEHLKTERIDRIYVSDLKRAVDTAAEIAKYHLGTEVAYEPRIREKNYGVYEKHPSGDYVDIVRKSGMPFGQFKPQNGESSMEVQERAVAFVKELAEKHRNETILIVSHGVVIRMLLMGLFHAGEDGWQKYQHKNAAVTIVDINEDGTATLEKLNYTGHLD